MTEGRCLCNEVFSAHAEVVPRLTGLVLLVMCILRVCGGSSSVGPHLRFQFAYSPRVRR